MFSSIITHEHLLLSLHYLNLNHPFSLGSFICPTQYIYLFLLCYTLSKTVVSPLQLYNVLLLFQTLAKGFSQASCNKFLSSVMRIYKFIATPTCCNTKQPHFPPTKLLSLIKIFHWAQRCTRLKHVIPMTEEQLRASAV